MLCVSPLYRLVLYEPVAYRLERHRERENLANESCQFWEWVWFVYYVASDFSPAKRWVGVRGDAPWSRWRRRWWRWPLMVVVLGIDRTSTPTATPSHRFFRCATAPQPTRCVGSFHSSACDVSHCTREQVCASLSALPTPQRLARLCNAVTHAHV
jgi:hypothetical protein